jgi:hypothetical protein
MVQFTAYRAVLAALRVKTLWAPLGLRWFSVTEQGIFIFIG